MISRISGFKQITSTNLIVTEVLRNSPYPNRLRSKRYHRQRQKYKRRSPFADLDSQLWQIRRNRRKPDFTLRVRFQFDETIIEWIRNTLSNVVLIRQDRIAPAIHIIFMNEADHFAFAMAFPELFG